MLIIVDLNQHLPPKGGDDPFDQHRLAHRLSELIRYHLYREYHLDTGTHALTNRDMYWYCRMKPLLLIELHRVGELALRYDKRRTNIKIRNRDAYVALSEELLDATGDA